jgi:hypothetical protein
VKDEFSAEGSRLEAWDDLRDAIDDAARALEGGGEQAMPSRRQRPERSAVEAERICALEQRAGGGEG